MSRACVIGWPIRHSRSPLIHGYWLKQHAIAGGYDKVEVAPEALDDFIHAIGGEYAGCNVTVPHKEAVLARLDDIDDTARAVGAVNTIWREAGQLRGMNTDVAGFLANLDHETPGWDTPPLDAVVLGAGGAARAVVYGLLQRGAAAVSIVNRSSARAQDLARELGPPARSAETADLTTLLRHTTLLVNATSLGMEGKPALDISLEGLNPAAVVTDLVYVPLRTALLEAAAARGNRVADGLGMLLHQAVPGFEKWFGVRPQVTPELRRIIEADLTQAAP